MWSLYIMLHKYVFTVCVCVCVSVCVCTSIQSAGDGSQGHMNGTLKTDDIHDLRRQ